jgi:predicted phosphodiesterase
MKIQVLSDLHLEFSPFRLEKYADAKGLILAGDIGDPCSSAYFELLKQASESFEWVVVVRGNHECYGMTITRTGEKIGTVCAQFPNVHYLQKKHLDVGEDVRIIGATLWSDVMDYQRSEVSTFIADYRKIRDWSVEMNNHEHFMDAKFIKSEIGKARLDHKKLVVVTHHAPHTRGTSRKEHLGSSLSSAFASDLSPLFVSPIVAWVYGHTHWSNVQNVGDVMLISNQRGYGDEETAFDPKFTFDV